MYIGTNFSLTFGTFLLVFHSHQQSFGKLFVIAVPTEYIMTDEKFQIIKKNKFLFSLHLLIVAS